MSSRRGSLSINIYLRMGISLLQLRPSCPPDDLPKSTELSAFLLYPEPTGSSTPAGRPPTAQAPSASSTSALHLRPKFLTSWSDSYQGRDPPPHLIFRQRGEVGTGRVGSRGVVEKVTRMADAPCGGDLGRS
jgi:hypothetical protein